MAEIFWKIIIEGIIIEKCAKNCTSNTLIKPERSVFHNKTRVSQCLFLEIPPPIVFIWVQKSRVPKEHAISLFGLFSGYIMC